MAWLSHFLEMTLCSNPVISTETAQQSGFFVPEKQKYSDHPMDWTALSMVLSQVQEEYHE